MSWTAPMTAVANATFFAAEWNTYIRDNLNATEAGAAQDVGSIMRRRDGFGNLNTGRVVSQYVPDVVVLTGGSAAFTPPPDGLGPSVSTSFNFNGAIIMITQAFKISNSGDVLHTSVDVTGDSFVSPQTDGLAQAPYYGITSGEYATGCSGGIWMIPRGSIDGDCTISVQHAVFGAGAFSIFDRRLIVLPI